MILITKIAKVNWNSANKKHYAEKGYTYTKMGDTFEVDVLDLTRGSHSIVEIQCDYCGTIVERMFRTHIRNTEQSVIEKDACRKCQPIKSEEGFIKNHNMTSGEFLQSDEMRQKSTDAIKLKYGVDNISHIPGAMEKMQKTRRERYSRDYFAEMMRGENNPMWKGGVTPKNREDRNCYEYQDWRFSVYKRDGFTCQVCGQVRGDIVAHHILGFAKYPKLRFEQSNGVTMCRTCHIEFHSKYGNYDFNDEDLIEFQTDYKKSVTTIETTV